MAGHRPGPWQVSHRNDTGYPYYSIHGVSGWEKHDTAMHEANARLMAAAPQLLEYLRESLDHIHNQTYRDKVTGLISIITSTDTDFEITKKLRLLDAHYDGDQPKEITL